MARKFGANCSKCQRSTEQQQSIKCFKIHSKDLLQNNDFHITSSIFLLSSVLVFYFFLILFFNSIVYRFFIARIFGVLPEYFRDWGGAAAPPAPPARTPVISTTLLFAIVCCFLIFIIRLRHWHWKLLSFRSSVFVIFHVLEPYSRTGRS